MININTQLKDIEGKQVKLINDLLSFEGKKLKKSGSIGTVEYIVRLGAVENSGAEAGVRIGKRIYKVNFRDLEYI
jgi:hypothetical protein